MSNPARWPIECVVGDEFLPGRTYKLAIVRYRRAETSCFVSLSSSPVISWSVASPQKSAEEAGALKSRVKLTRLLLVSEPSFPALG